MVIGSDLPFFPKERDVGGFRVLGCWGFRVSGC